MTAIISEAEAITQAHVVLSLGEALLDAQDCEPVSKAAVKLKNRLEDYDLINAGDLHPTFEFPDLMYGHPHDALDTALTRIADEVTGLAAELAGEVWAHTGEHIGEDAAFVRGENKGEQAA